MSRLKGTCLGGTLTPVADQDPDHLWCQFLGPEAQLLPGEVLDGMLGEQGWSRQGLIAPRALRPLTYAHGGTDAGPGAAQSGNTRGEAGGRRASPPRAPRGAEKNAWGVGSPSWAAKSSHHVAPAFPLYFSLHLHCS